MILVECGFAWLGVPADASGRVEAAIYVLTNLFDNLCLIFFLAAFPGHARDKPAVVKAERQVLASEISAEEYALAEEKEIARLGDWTYYNLPP